MTDNNAKPVVTAVGRLLKSTNGTPRVHSMIQRNDDGTFTEIIRKRLN